MYNVQKKKFFLRRLILHKKTVQTLIGGISSGSSQFVIVPVHGVSHPRGVNNEF